MGGEPGRPLHNWPTGPIKGFDYYYGFIGDDTSQWQPNNLFRNTTPIEPYLGNPGWNLITAMADEAIGRIKMLNEVQPDRPFMIYYAPGGTHCAAPPDAGVGRQDQRHASVRRRLEQAA